MVNRLIALNTKHFSDKQKNNQKMSQFQRKVLAKSLRFTQMRNEKGEMRNGNEEMGNASEQDNSPILNLPEMPKKLPKVVQLLVSRTPDVYKPAVAHAIFPSLGAHLWKVRFPYIDNVMHEATFMNVLMAGTGAGKDCISQPINHIMADIRKRDADLIRQANGMDTRGTRNMLSQWVHRGYLLQMTDDSFKKLRVKN